MTNASATRPKQRTKAGCLICRQKRKKCDEKLPACDRCQRSGSKCQWPSSADLVDRRFASHSEFRHRKSSHAEDHDPSLVVSKPSLILEAGAVHTLVNRDIETAVCYHFDSEFGRLLMPPGSHPSFFKDWATEIRHLRCEFKAFYYAQMACSASHLHYKHVSAQMQELALTYYCNALRQLGHILASNSTGLEHHNGIIMCILTLCLHGSTGRGTTSDIERHVKAVTKLLSMRIQSEPSVIGRPFDRLGVECALHQSFLVSQGLWSEMEENPRDLDLQFWNVTEGLLDQSNLYLHRPEGFRTPVVGIPASLLRTAMILRQQYRRPWFIDQAALDSVRPWVVFWEQKSDQLVDGSITGEQTVMGKVRTDASHLYAVIVSLLFEQLSKGDSGAAYHPQPASSDSWQVRRAMDIVSRNWDNEDWARYAMVDWPVYTLGLLVTTLDDVDRVRWDAQRRWELTKSGQAVRFWNDLEKMWTSRTSPQTSPSEILASSEDRGSQSSSSPATGYSPPSQHGSDLVLRLRNPTPALESMTVGALGYSRTPSLPLVGDPGIRAYGNT